MEYNKLAPPNLRFEVDDRIVSVNGSRGSAETLVEIMRSNSGDFNVEILRYPGSSRW